MVAIQGFYNPELTKRFKILDVLESIIVNQAEQMNKDNIASLLDFYTHHRMGSRILIETLKANADQTNAAVAAN